MSISVKKENDKTVIELGNGHAEALEKIVKDYQIVDDTQAIGFMLAVFSQGEGKPISTNGKNFVPSENIKQKINPQPNGGQQQ